MGAWTGTYYTVYHIIWIMGSNKNAAQLVLLVFYERNGTTVTTAHGRLMVSSTLQIDTTTVPDTPEHIFIHLLAHNKARPAEKHQQPPPPSPAATVNLP